MSETANLCERCGAFGEIPHGWVEGDCVLPHRAHSRKLVAGTHVCEPCLERWDEWLAEVVDLYATLPDVLRVGSISDDTAEHQHMKVSGSPALMRLGAWALLHPRMLNSHVKGDDGELHHTGTDGLPDVADVLHNHAQAVYDAKGWTGQAPDTVSGAAAVIRSNREVLAGTPDVDTFDAELRWVRRSLRTAHGISDAKPVGRCPSLDGWGRECGGPLWPARGGSMSVSCSHCGRKFGQAFLSHLGGMMSA